MSVTNEILIDEMSPSEAADLLQREPTARMVDVRNEAEWTFVGVPDLSAYGRALWRVELFSFPANVPNQAFLDDISAHLEADGRETADLLFICRSGMRSMTAARAVAAEAAAGRLPAGVSLKRVINVREGFEGDLDGRGHRGTVGGWKVNGLPWRQS
ncbi:MAG: rhodanese-like domain-containing protein [Pseudomonadota bacterium]